MRYVFIEPRRIFFMVAPKKHSILKNPRDARIQTHANTGALGESSAGIPWATTHSPIRIKGFVDQYQSLPKPRLVQLYQNGLRLLLEATWRNREAVMRKQPSKIEMIPLRERLEAIEIVLGKGPSDLLREQFDRKFEGMDEQREKDVRADLNRIEAAAHDAKYKKKKK